MRHEFFHQWASCVMAFFFLLVCGGSYARISPFLPVDLLAQQQQLLRTCPSPQPAASFCNLNMGNFCATGSGQINGNLNVNGIITGQDGLGYGNTLIVDQVDGDDITGAVNGPRFKTISAALAQAQPGDVVWVFPGVYNETVNIPASVVLKALCRDAVTIQQLNVTAPTDLVTMQEGSYIGDFILMLTSSEPVQLRGIYHNGSATPAILVIDTNVIFVTNSATTGSAGTYGIYMTGIGGPIGFLGDIIYATILEITSSISGTVRGIYIDSPTLLEIITPINQVFGGTTDTIAFEMNNPACVVAVQGGSFSGYYFNPLGSPDISQTQGTLNLDATYLGNSNANGLGFTDLIYPNTFVWGDPDFRIGGGRTLYMFPGTQASSSVPVYINAFQKFLAYTMSVTVAYPPGIGQTTTWALQQNGLDTPLTVTLADNNTQAVLTGVSAHFGAGDNISMQMVTSAGALTGQVTVTVGIY